MQREVHFHGRHGARLRKKAIRNRNLKRDLMDGFGGLGARNCKDFPVRETVEQEEESFRVF